MSITQVTECQTAEDVRRLALEVARKRRSNYVGAKVALERLAQEAVPMGNIYADKAIRDLKEQLSEQQRLNDELAIKIEELTTRNRWFATEIKSVLRRGCRPIEGEDIPKKSLNFAVLLKIVAFKADFLPAALVGQGRDRTLTYWRHILMYLAHRFTGYSFPQIGRLTGGRDHTTVLHGVRKITAMRPIDAALDSIITDLEHEIAGLFP